MTDAEYEAAKARVQSHLARWTPILGLSDWRFVHDWRRQDNHDLQSTDGGDAAFARTHVNWEYEEASITWWLPEIVDGEMDDAYLEQIVIHELLHVVLREMRDDAVREGIPHEERVASRLAKALVRSRASGQRPRESEGESSIRS